MRDDKFTLHVREVGEPEPHRPTLYGIILCCADCGKECNRIGYDINWDAIVLRHPKNTEFGKQCPRSENKYKIPSPAPLVISLEELDRGLEPHGEKSHGAASAT